MIEKIADSLGVTPQVLIICAVVFVVLFVLIYIKITMDEKKGVNSQEKADIRKLVNNVVPDGNAYIAAYAHSKEVYGTARMRREVYHYYAVAFRQTQTDHMWVIPIGVENGKIGYTEPFRVSAEVLSYVGGGPAELVLHFPNSKDKVILRVEESNTKMGAECQVNIQQPEEAKEFRAFAEAFQERVNDALGVNKKGRKV